MERRGEGREGSEELAALSPPVLWVHRMFLEKSAAFSIQHFRRCFAVTSRVMRTTLGPNTAHSVGNRESRNGFFICSRDKLWGAHQQPQIVLSAFHRNSWMKPFFARWARVYCTMKSSLRFGIWNGALALLRDSATGQGGQTLF
eukprot:scaffold111852_cov27-Tisochrysis_lutea.AAC.1